MHIDDMKPAARSIDLHLPAATSDAPARNEGVARPNPRAGIAQVRIASVAAEAASSALRNDTGTGTEAWMASPRRLFGGRTALEACGSQGEYLRAMLLLQLDLGPDLDAEQIDDLMSEDPHEDRAMLARHRCADASDALIQRRLNLPAIRQFALPSDPSAFDVTADAPDPLPEQGSEILAGQGLRP